MLHYVYTYVHSRYVPLGYIKPEKTVSPNKENTFS